MDRAGPGPLILDKSSPVNSGALSTVPCYVNSGDGAAKKKKKKKEEGRITWCGGDGWLDGEDDLKPTVETVVDLAVGGSCRFLFFPFFFLLPAAFGSLPLPSAVLLFLW